MNIGIKRIFFFNKNTNYFSKNNTTFRRLSMYRNISLAIGTAALLSLTSCKKSVQHDTVDLTTTIENNDTLNSTIDKTEKGISQKRYHYFPKNNYSEFNSSNCDWVETISPDGRITKDSLGYKISISPEGDRTVIKTEKDTVGNTIITTTLPDGCKIIKTEYKPKTEGEVFFIKNTYWPNGKIKNNTYFIEYPSDSTNINGEKIVEKEDLYYSENGILLKWESTKIDSTRSEKYNKYDTQKRLIYDDIKNEKYEYNGDNQFPFRSVSKHGDCKRITLYNQDGNIEKIYFKASDGTITE